MAYPDAHTNRGTTERNSYYLLLRPLISERSLAVHYEWKILFLYLVSFHVYHKDSVYVPQWESA